MRWIKVTDRLPKAGPDGYSEPVLVYFGKRFLPEIAQYSPDNTTVSHPRMNSWACHEPTRLAIKPRLISPSERA